MKFNPDNLNIHELAVEEPEKEQARFFNPEREITDEMWRGMNSWVKQQISRAETSEKERTRLVYSVATISDLARIKFLASISGRPEPEIDKEKLDDFLKKLCLDVGKSSAGNYWPETSLLKIGYSLSASIAMLGLKELPSQTMNDLAAQADMIRNKDYPDLANPEYVSQAFSAGKIGGIDLRGNDFSDAEKKHLLKHFEELQRNSYSAENSRKILYSAYCLKIMGIDATLSKANWDEFLEELDRINKITEVNDSAYSDLAERLFFMTILSYDNVNILQKGQIKLSNNKKQEIISETLPMPEQKQF